MSGHVPKPNRQKEDQTLADLALAVVCDHIDDFSESGIGFLPQHVLSKMARWPLTLALHPSLCFQDLGGEATVDGGDIAADRQRVQREC